MSWDPNDIPFDLPRKGEEISQTERNVETFAIWLCVTIIACVAVCVGAGIIFLWGIQ